MWRAAVHEKASQMMVEAVQGALPRKSALDVRPAGNEPSMLSDSVLRIQPGCFCCKCEALHGLIGKHSAACALRVVAYHPPNSAGCITTTLHGAST